MAVATYVHRQEAAKAQGGGEHIVSWMTVRQVLSVA